MSGRFLTSSGPIGFVLQLPTGTRILSTVLIGLSILIQILRFTLSPVDLKTLFRGNSDDSLAFPWLVVVPGSVIWNPWTVLTAGLCEVGVIELIFSLLALSLCGRYLERIYGTIEFVKFCLFTIGLSNVLSVFFNVIEHYALRDSGLYLYGMSYHGLMGLQTGFLVALTQLIPEHQVQLFGVIKIRVKNLPMLYVGFSNVMCLLGYQSPFFLIQVGWLVSWYYLRFVKWNDGGDFRGDRSETFAFAMWFPSFIQPIIRKISDIAFTVAVKLRLLKQWTPVDLESGAYAPLPGTARAEAERRRAMALKALDQRLASNKTTVTAAESSINVSDLPPSSTATLTSPISRPSAGLLSSENQSNSNGMQTSSPLDPGSEINSKEKT
ncbi:eukaryotic integral membrane protein-domain-containing protein [Phakopsora pachyrhizi]|uniref:Eukaryotic integral membrane protein-domain-containing protein n=1 Tax=Phakopsora pachyrhizi TaxID=170000 RepID=A0AAV0B081_PHAPC|nr:eukaryotic integral membrane protein-domain-containing protein [Phakopsora pachyrhizi]CAH7675462.1 eukaryotic integral membrane protein-domain-containing protein [Phakopsora pachyrhizi]